MYFILGLSLLISRENFDLYNKVAVNTCINSFHCDNPNLLLKGINVILDQDQTYFSYPAGPHLPRNVPQQGRGNMNMNFPAYLIYFRAGDYQQKAILIIYYTVYIHYYQKFGIIKFLCFWNKSQIQCHFSSEEKSWVSGCMLVHKVCICVSDR